MALYPLHRLLRQLVECGHAEFEVFFLRVLDFVVADAVQALDEHHHGRDARCRDFSGVMQRAARQAVNFAAGFADGFVAQRDEFVVERARVNLPEAFPTHFHVAFLRKFFAGGFGFLKHACERRAVEMALIQRDATFLDDARDDARFGRAGANGANAVAAAPGDFVNLGTHLRGGEEGVFAAIHRRAAGVRGLSVESDRVPLDAERPEHRAEREIEIEQHRALLNVEFEIRGGVGEFGAARAHIFKVDVVFAQRIGKAVGPLPASWPKEPDAVTARANELYKRFYGDTSLNGYLPAVQCGLEYFGADRILFGTDMPYDESNGVAYIRDTIQNVNDLGLSTADRCAVFAGNAERVLGVTIRGGR